ncbi:hypothetical protein PSYJYH_000058 [Bacillus phage PSYJ-YH]|nr:hypothetical protein PSYJYH_000058 [Bacillus phage PSYJ-YH]
MFNNRADINYIEYTYDATFEASRNEEVTMPNGSIKTIYTKFLDSTACGVYVHRAEEWDGRRDVQPLTGDFRVFTFRDLDLHKGDDFKVTQYGKVYNMVAGEPIRYETHQEIVCHEKGLA